jgi:hypothetical protein
MSETMDIRGYSGAILPEKRRDRGVVLVVLCANQLMIHSPRKRHAENSGKFRGNRLMIKET